MEFNNPYFTKLNKIELLQRWILIHSFLYYQLNYNVVSDERFDNNCRQLKELKGKYPKTYKRSKFYYSMHDFDGSTGYGYYELLREDHQAIISRDAFYLRRKY
jgi:hypothetical protein